MAFYELTDNTRINSDLLVEIEKENDRRRRLLARPITRSDVRAIPDWLQVQPMQDYRCYNYRGVVIYSRDGWWNARVDGTTQRAGALDTMLVILDTAINQKIAADAIKAVLATS